VKVCNKLLPIVHPEMPEGTTFKILNLRLECKRQMKNVDETASERS
jgi:hypothetical protein